MTNQTHIVLSNAIKMLADLKVPVTKSLEVLECLLASITDAYITPIFMYSEVNGNLGLYWDTGKHYLDIEIEPETDKFSLFYRDRITGKEQFFDDQLTLTPELLQLIPLKQ